MINKACIRFIEYYLPEQILDNEQLAAENPEWSVEKISAKTGINRRHIARENELASDLAIKAAGNLLNNNHIDPASIDFILLCTQSPDYLLPTTACLIQDKLGLSKGCGALDFNLGCSGFIYGLGLAKGLINTNQAKNVLLITADTYSKYIHPTDKSNRTLFGDAAAATLLSAKSLDNYLDGEILDFEYGTDGSGANSLIVKNGGAKSDFSRVKTLDTLEPDDNYLYMDGKAIFDFTAFKIPELVKDILIKHDLSMDQIDLFIFHQANKFMLNTIRKRAGIPEEKFFISLENSGNTVSSTIPIALKEAFQQNRIQKGNKVLLAGFGVGLSMGATIIQF